jgi:SAM-dependent methyltransferase
VNSPQNAAENTAPSAEQSDDYVPFAVRFRAWWEGVEPEAVVKKDEQQADATAMSRRSQLIVVDKTDDAPFEETDGRAERRYRLWGRIYGDGASFPGGTETSGKLMKDLGVLKPHRVLDLGTRLGDLTRIVALQFGANIVGMEPDSELATLGMKLSDIKGLADTAGVQHYEPASLDLGGEAYDFIVLRDRLFGMDAREHVFAQMAGALKPRGRILLTDLMPATADMVSSREIQALCSSENRSVLPWTLGELQEICNDTGLFIRGFRDETDVHCQHLILGWTNFAESLANERLDRTFVDVLIEEAERVKRRLTAIKNGRARFFVVELGHQVLGASNR